MVNFGEKLRNLRIKNKLTQEQLANKLRLTKSIISAYENGLRMPSYDILINLSKIFDVSTDYLLGNVNPQSIDLSGLNAEEKDAILKVIELLRTK